MPNTFIKIAAVTVGAGGVSTVTFSSIPSTYTDLQLVSCARTNRADVSDPIKINFNSDTGSNYPFVYLLANSTGVSSGSGTAAFSIAGIATSTNATADTFGNDQCYITNYTSSNTKSLSIDSVTENNAADATTRFDSFRWTGTSAITSIVLAPAAGTLINQYSTFTLYGINKS